MLFFLQLNLKKAKLKMFGIPLTKTMKKGLRKNKRHLTYNSDENQLFFNGKSVCYFADNRATDGTFEGTEVHSANGDIGIITERDRNGNITGLKQMEIPELTDFLEKSWKEK